MQPEGISRRRALELAGAGVAAGLLSACGAKEKVLRVGSQKGGTKALMLASGALAGAPYRVEWSEFPAAQNLLEGISSGAVDVGLVGDGPFAFAYQAGQPVVAVAARRVVDRPTQALAILVPKASNARNLADIKGQRLATTRGSIGHFLALRALEQAGMRPDAVSFVFLSPSDAAAAMHNGSVAAWSTWVPYTTLALSEGARVLVDSHELLDITSFDVANRQSVADKRPLLTDFLQRESRAQLWALHHPEDYAPVLARETGMALAVTRVVARIHAFQQVPLDAAMVTAQQLVVDTYRHGGALTAQRSLGEAFAPLV